MNSLFLVTCDLKRKSYCTSDCKSG